MFKKKNLPFIGFILAGYLLLMIPDTKNNAPLIKANEKPFVWDADGLWLQLEKDFIEAQKMDTAQLDSVVVRSKEILMAQFSLIKNESLNADDSNFTIIEKRFFSMAPYIAVRPSEVKWYVGFYNELRNFVKLQSQQWNIQQPVVRNNVYRLLYGMRAAIEEVQLQTDSKYISAVMSVKQEPSKTPAATIFGIEVHSGDLLVSRGGAEVSALISRGNDYPGNFSHVALLYVNDKTNEPFLIESHIEKGVAISTVQQYEQDKKLRFMVMRPRADLPVMMANPMLPHEAAYSIYNESKIRHIPYDFKMNFVDSSAMFCSEVGSYAYRQKNIHLWKSLSTISSQGVVNWLNDFGVENFVTQMQSDLEYDPQLSLLPNGKKQKPYLKIIWIMR